jgi:hypothetical protein
MIAQPVEDFFELRTRPQIGKSSFPEGESGATLRPQPFAAGAQKEQLPRMEPAVAFLLSTSIRSLPQPDLA